MTAREKEILAKSVEVLIKELAPKKIYLFGSRAKKKSQPASDFDFALDCAVPDMSRKRQVKDLLDQVAGLYTVDFVFLKEVEPGFRKIILKTGELVYGQK